MAFTSKAGSLIRETITKTAGSNALTPMHSIYNAVRSMSSSKIFVGGLNYLTDDQSLRQAFTGFGEVTEAKVIVDRESGRSRGFGFVSFTSCEEASAALSGMDGQELQGRTIRVNYATERTGGGGFRSAYGGGGGYGGSGYGDGGYRAGDGGFGGNSGGYSGDGQGDDFRGGRTSEMSRDNYKNEDGDYAGSSGKGY